MALKPTIYKFRISLSNFDQNLFCDLDLTLAQHPSETLERMWVRVLAYCLNAKEKPEFTKGLSTPEEPDLWAKNLQGETTLWLDVGEPKAERIKKSCRQSKQVKVYSFNQKSDTWWKQEAGKLRGMNPAIFQLPWQGLHKLCEITERSNECAVSIDFPDITVQLHEQNTALALKRLH